MLPRTAEYWQPRVGSHGICFVDTEAGFREMERVLHRAVAVGLDAEWKPTKNRFKAKVSILQIACLLCAETGSDKNCVVTSSDRNQPSKAKKNVKDKGKQEKGKGKEGRKLASGPLQPNVSQIESSGQKGLAHSDLPIGGKSDSDMWEERLFILDLLVLHPKTFAESMKSMLRSPEILKLGFGFKDDLRNLAALHPSKDMHGCFDKVEPFVDVGTLYWRVQISTGQLRANYASYTPGLSRLVNEVLGAPLCKDMQCSDWEARPLSPEQLAYAAADASCLLALFDALICRSSLGPATSPPETGHPGLVPSEPEPEPEPELVPSLQNPPGLACLLGDPPGLACLLGDMAVAAPGLDAEPSTSSVVLVRGGSDLVVRPSGVAMWQRRLSISSTRAIRRASSASLKDAHLTAASSSSAVAESADDMANGNGSEKVCSGASRGRAEAAQPSCSYGSGQKPGGAFSSAGSRARFQVDRDVLWIAAECYGERLLVAELAGKGKPKKPKNKKEEKGKVVVPEPDVAYQGPPPWKTSGDGQGVPKFLCDVMVEGLAKQLRCVGIDAASPPAKKSEPRKLVEQVEREGRVLLTRDSKLLQRRLFARNQVYAIKNLAKGAQLREVLTEFGLAVRPCDLLSRCVRCNGAFVQTPLSAQEAVQLAPPHQQIPACVLTGSVHEFWKCGSCSHIYWEGSQFDRALQQFAGLCLTT